MTSSPAAKTEVDSHVIVVANKKGGVGKTTTAGYLAVGLAESGRRTLAVDIDSQANLTQWLLDHEAFEANDKDLMDAMLRGAPLEDSIVPTRWPGLDLAPASTNMAALEIGMAPLPMREWRLRRALAGLGNRYRYIIIDCPPESGLVVLNAIAAKKKAQILVPIQAANFAIAGMGEFHHWVEAMREMEIHDAEWLAILPTLFNPKERISKELVPVLTGLGITILGSPIPRRIGIEDLVAERAVATERRLPAIAVPYGELVKFVIREMENGRPVVLEDAHGKSA